MKIAHFHLKYFEPFLGSTSLDKVKVIDSEDLAGNVRVLNIRFYNINHQMQVDIEFDGGFRVNSSHGKIWIDGSNVDKFSKIKLNRYLRRRVGPFLKTHLQYFGIDLPAYYNINKIRWVQKN